VNDDLLAAYLETGDESLLANLAAKDADESRALRAALSEQAAWQEPSPGLLDDIVAEIAHTPQQPSASESVAPVVSIDTARERRSRARTWVAVAAGVAAGLLVAVGVSQVDLGGSEGTRVALSPTDLAPGADGTARYVDRPAGVEIELDIDGLGRAKPGTFYQAWVKGEKGLVSIGTFHSGGHIVLWSGVDPREYPALSVTVEPEDGDPASSGQRLFTAEIGS
jgi:hypothetical protein